MNLTCSLVTIGMGLLSFVVPALVVLGIYKRIRAVGGIEGIRQHIQQRVAENLARAYRQVAPTWRTRTALWVSLITLAVGLAFLAGGVVWQVHKITETRLLSAEGIQIAATVIDATISENDDGDANYTIRYTFEAVANDTRQEITRKQSVPRSVYTQLEKGGAVAVIYAASDPELNRILATYQPGHTTYLPMIVLCSISMGLFLLVFVFLRQHAKALRLDTEGVTANLQILDRYIDTDSDSDTCYIAYQIPGAEVIRHSVAKETYQRLSACTTVTVRYLPGDPGVFRPIWLWA